MHWLVATATALVRLGEDGAVTGLFPAEPLCLVRDARQPRAAYAGLASGAVLRTLDGGVDWMTFGEVPAPVFSLAVSVWDGSVYAGCEPSAIFRWAGGEGAPRRLAALEALPSQPTWSFPPRPWTSHVRWIAPSPDGPALVCGIELGGILRSPDGGETWDDQRPGAHADCHCLAWPVGGRILEAAGGGAAESTDQGLTWSRCDAGLDRRYCWAICTDPGDAQTAFLSASPGPSQAHHSAGQADAALYRRHGSGPWQRLSGQPGSGLPQRFDHLPVALGAVPGRPGHVTAWLRDGQAYETRDAGESWLRLRGPLAGRGGVLAAVAVGP